MHFRDIEGPVMGRKDKLDLALQNMRNALLLLDEIDELFAAAQLQMAIDCIVGGQGCIDEISIKCNRRDGDL